MNRRDTIMKLCIAGAQIPVTENVKINLETINRAIDYAINKKADVLLTPEGSLSGYTHKFDQKQVSDLLKTILNKKLFVGYCDGVSLSVSTEKLCDKYIT